MQAIHKIRSATFDLLLSFTQARQDALFALFSGIPSRFGYGGSILKHFAYQHRFHWHLKRKAEISEHEAFFSLFEMLLSKNSFDSYSDFKSVKRFSSKPCIYIKSEELSFVKNLLQDRRAHRPIILGTLLVLGYEALASMVLCSF